MRPQELKVGPVAVGSFLEEIARLMEPEAASAGTKIVLDVVEGLPPVSGDAELLKQAFTNLVANAIQAMPGGGKVTLAARCGAEGTIEVRVIDEGVGIPPEDRDRIFRLYYTTKPDGSGIGLSMVYRIVQLHDGHIDIESEVGRGTTMIMTLPAASP